MPNRCGHKVAQTQSLIEAIAYGIAEGFEDTELLEALHSQKLMSKSATVADLLRFKVAYLKEIRAMSRKLLKVQLLEGLQTTFKTLKDRVKYSEAQVQVAASNAMMRFSELIDGEDAKVNGSGSASRMENPNQVKNEKKKRLEELIQKAKAEVVE